MWKAAPWTWSHVQFFCQEPAVVDARAAWLGDYNAEFQGDQDFSSLLGFRLLLGRSQIHHDQLEQMITLAEQGTNRSLWADGRYCPNCADFEQT